MNSTLELMVTTLFNRYDELTLEELAIMFKEDASAEIISASFIKVYKLLINISKDYYGLDEDDIVSWGLEKLDLCLRTYSSELGKFTTYYCKVMKNKFREETQKNNYMKRKARLESLESAYDIGVVDEYDLLELNLPKNLTSKEYKYCVFASKGYDNKTIAEMLNVSRMTISNIRKSLKIKMLTLQLL